MKIGIVGAGIMGRLLAFSLSHDQNEVTLFDGNADNCSVTAAGLLTPLTELEKNPAVIADLGHKAIKQYWPILLKQLGNDIFFRLQGSLVLSHPRDTTELNHFVQMITQKSNAHYKKLSQADILELEPEVTRFNEAYFFPEDGQLDNQSLLESLENKLQYTIKWLKNAWVTSVQPNKVVLDDQIIDFDWVIDCRGLGGREHFSDLRGVRGELIWLHAPEVNINRPIRFLHPRYSLYIAPRPNQHYILGASEIEAEDYSTISVRTTLELLTAAYSIHPGFAEARIIKTATHCRPTLSDHLPKIKFDDGFIAVNGLYRHGFLIAPTLVADITQGMQHGFHTVTYPQLWEKCA